MKETDSVKIKDYVKANKYTQKCMVVSAIVVFLAWVLNVLHIFIVDQHIMNRAVIGMALFVVAAFIVKYTLGYERVISNYIMISLLVGMITFGNVEVSYHGTLFMIFPIVCSILYNESKYKTYAFWFTSAGLFISVIGGYKVGLCDSNMLILTTSTTANTVKMILDGAYEINEDPVCLIVYYVFPRFMALLAFNSLLNSIKSGIQEKTRQEQESRRMAEEEMIANQAKSVFLANMSHEIRTPINTVLGLDTMILRESDDPTIKEYAVDIKSAGESLLSIINDILDISKIESGKMEILPVDYETSTLINDVVNMITPRYKAKNLGFRLNVDKNLPSKLHGDDVRIRQILINLLTNAVKYTESGEISLAIKSEVNDGIASIRFTVKDTGIGIAKENIDKLFQKFVRIEETRNRNIEGTGLGINIVTMLLQLMDSELEVSSEYGRGSEFSFVLCQEIIDATPIGNIEKKRKASAKNYKYDVAYKIPDVNILVVDDNVMNLKVFSLLLKKFECGIDEAENGEKCLDLVGKKRYDIIFMDHMMPGKDGVETFHELRSLDYSLNKDTPVVVLTANAISGAKEGYLAEGFTDFLAKPIKPAELEEMISKLVPDKKKVTLSDKPKE